MLARDAKDAARHWVLEEASRLPSFHSAFLYGSAGIVPDDAEFPASSDVDVKIVLENPPVVGDPQKHLFRDVVLDVSYASSEDFRSPEVVLGTYYTAVHFVRPHIVLDPSGELRSIQPTVAREYAKRAWVRKRCVHAREQFEESLTWLSSAAPIHDQVFAWLLGTLVMTHMVLVADLANPTIRKCLVTSRDVLARYGHLPLHEKLLGILGSASMERAQVDALLGSCAEAFDAAKVVRTTPVPYASNISDYARPIAIEGGQEMVTAGFHRETVLWIGQIHTLCQTILYNDASDEVRSRHTPAYEHLLRELGVTSYDDLAERNEQLRQLLPDLWRVTEEIIATNPAIQD